MIEGRDLEQFGWKGGGRPAHFFDTERLEVGVGDVEGTVSLEVESPLLLLGLQSVIKLFLQFFANLDGRSSD